MSSILLHAWTLHKKDGEYFIPYTHWVYLNEIVKYYDKVCLLSPVNYIAEKESNSLESISVFKNVSVYELPYSEGYVQAIRHFYSYKKAYRALSKDFDTVYARYPTPFGWLQKKYFEGKRRIIHFVGDPVDTIKNNPNLSSLKKLLYTKLFIPEHLQFMKACKKAKVFTNGYHLSERLKKYDIQSVPLISSTLTDGDFYFDDKKEINPLAPKIIYVGYLRKAKGIETIIEALRLLTRRIPAAQLTIVGTGESEELLRLMVEKGGIENVFFTGHIDSRDELNKLLRSHDIFCFASLSEGSPRVILEAMANGLAVVSTPVGSLPYTFEENKEILFADFNNSQEFYEQLTKLSSDPNFYDQLRSNSYNKVSDFKIDKFLKTIFHEA